MAQFKENDRVKLKAMPENGVGEELATVIAYEGDNVYFVEIDEEYAHDKYDDCYREVTVDQIEALE